MEIVNPSDFFAKDIFREKDFRESVERFNWSQYQGKPILIQGCGTLPIPTWAFLVLTAKLAPLAKSISFGEVKRPIPVMGRLGEAVGRHPGNP